MGISKFGRHGVGFPSHSLVFTIFCDTTFVAYKHGVLRNFVSDTMATNTFSTITSRLSMRPVMLYHSLYVYVYSMWFSKTHSYKNKESLWGLNHCCTSSSFHPPTFLPPSFLLTLHQSPTSLSQTNCQTTPIQLSCLGRSA